MDRLVQLTMNATRNAALMKCACPRHGTAIGAKRMQTVNPTTALDQETGWEDKNASLSLRPVILFVLSSII